MAASHSTLTKQKDSAKAVMSFEFIHEFSDHKLESNTLCYYGTDHENNVLFIKESFRKNKPRELILLLKLEDGRIFVLPDYPNTVITDNGMSSWSAAGLKDSELQYLRSTRITYNGLLRSETWKYCNDVDTNIEHVRLNCIFVANTKPNLLIDTSPWYIFRKNTNVQEIDQYGSFMAEVTIGNSPSKQLFLRGIRRSQWGKFMVESACITGSDELGNIFYLKSNETLQKIIGHVKSPDNTLYPIESSNLDVKVLLNLYDDGYDNYDFNFSAGKQQYVVSITLRRATRQCFLGGNLWNSRYDCCQLELKLNNTDGIGMFEVQKPFQGACSFVTFSSKIPTDWILYKRVLRDEIKDEEQIAYVLPFGDPKCQMEYAVGQKGALLAELTTIATADFTVPKGFCVTARALEEHLQFNEQIRDRIDELVAICHENIAQDTEAYSKELVAALQNTPMATPVEEAVRTMLQEFECDHNGKLLYAVRSSVVDIDSEYTSPAGQNSSELAVPSNLVVLYITHCWASLYTYKSVEYRRQNGLPIRASMGVCVQVMINSEAAGVMSTRYPVTGNPMELYIESNYGLGESVMLGVVESDAIVVQRNLKGSLSFKSSTIGKKSEKVVVKNEAGGTQYIKVSKNDKSRLSISQELALKLAEIGMKIDRMYNAPRDIEWAVAKGKIYLLQCRPVTGLEAWTEFEITHEFDSGVPSKEDILVPANLVEPLPIAATPLTLSTVVRGINAGMEASYARQTDDDTFKQHIFVFNSKCFLNYSTTFLRRVEEKIGLKSKILDIAMCGHEINTEENNKIAFKRNRGPANRLTGIQIVGVVGQVIAEFYNFWMMITKVNEIVDAYRSIWKTFEKWSSPGKLYMNLDKLLREYFKLSIMHTLITKRSVALLVYVLLLLAQEREELTEDFYSDAELLLNSCINVSSAQAPILLKEIIQIIKESGLSDDFQGVEMSKALSWLEEKCPKAHEKVEKFMKVYGHRGFEEYELITETWNMNPEKFLSTVQSLVNATDDSNETTEVKEEEKVAEATNPEPTYRLQSIENWLTWQWKTPFIVPLAQRTALERDHAKNLLIQLVHLMRTGYRQLADALVREGRLPDRELVFFLTHEELQDIVNAPCPSLIGKAVMRRKLRPALQKCKFKEVNHGMPQIAEPKTTDKTSVKGIQVCKGTVTGRAYVALSFEDAAGIQKGDILIIHTMDFGWVLYFPLLAGIVTELGGLISHGSVIARRCGLPCIVSAENATTTFKTGDTVVLNRTAGTLEVAEDADAATS